MTSTQGSDRTGYVVEVDAFRFDRGLSPAVLIGTMWRAKWLLLVVGLLCGVLGYAASYAFTPQFEANASIVWAGNEDEGSLLGGLGSQVGSLIGGAGLLGGADTAQAEALAILRSRALAIQFIEQNDLIPVLFAKHWDQEHGEWKEAVREDPPSIWDAYKLFDGKIRSVNENSRSGVIEVSIRSDDPVTASQWANETVALANQMLRQQRMLDARSSLEFLNAELVKQGNIGLRETLYRMIEVQLNTIMMAEVRPDFAFRVIDPAIPPDADDKVFPSRAVFLVIGGLLGGLIAVIIVLLRQKEEA